jgi:hypothetical protein
VYKLIKNQEANLEIKQGSKIKGTGCVRDQGTKVQPEVNESGKKNSGSKL